MEEVQRKITDDMKGDFLDLPLKKREQFTNLVTYLRSLYRFDRIPAEFFDYSNTSTKENSTQTEIKKVVIDTKLIEVPKPTGFWDF